MKTKRSAIAGSNGVCRSARPLERREATLAASLCCFPPPGLWPRLPAVTRDSPTAREGRPARGGGRAPPARPPRALPKLAGAPGSSATAGSRPPPARTRARLAGSWASPEAGPTQPRPLPALARPAPARARLRSPRTAAPALPAEPRRTRAPPCPAPPRVGRARPRPRACSLPPFFPPTLVRPSPRALHPPPRRGGSVRSRHSRRHALVSELVAATGAA